MLTNSRLRKESAAQNDDTENKMEDLSGYQHLSGAKCQSVCGYEQSNVFWQLVRLILLLGYGFFRVEEPEIKYRNVYDLLLSGLNKREWTILLAIYDTQMNYILYFHNLSNIQFLIIQTGISGLIRIKSGILHVNSRHLIGLYHCFQRYLLCMTPRIKFKGHLLDKCKAGK